MAAASAEALLALLGKPEGDPSVSAYLSSPIRPGRALPAPEVKRYPPSSVYVNHKTLGVSLCFEAGILDAVHVYADGADGFAGFAGALPHGIRLAPTTDQRENENARRSTGKNIVEALGEPSTKGNASGMVWMQYDALGVKGTSRRRIGEDPDVPARCVSLWSP